MSSPPPAPTTAWSAGARAAGMIVALGYLLGFVRGPVMAVIGGLALVTLGRGISAPAPEDLVLAGSLAVLAGAVGVGALRWGVVDLGDLRGIQAVLGPTLLVGPTGAAAACWIAAGGAVTALAAWLAAGRAADARAPGPHRLILGLWGLEAFVGALVVVSVFWAPSIPRGSLGGDAAGSLLAWAGVIAAAGGAAAGLALVLARHPAWRWATLAVGAVATAAGAGLVARVL